MSVDMNFHHLGIFVPNLEQGRFFLQNMIGVDDFSDKIIDENIDVQIIFGSDSAGVRYELVAPLSKESPVTSVLNSGKNILNHIAYTTSDLDRELSRFRASGCMIISPPTPAKAFQDRRVSFLLTPLNLIIELIEIDVAG